MLEEALNTVNYPPGETALALLSFLRHELPAGGSAAEVRFCRLFPLICARVFGVLNEDLNEYELGGWLSRQNAWNTHLNANAQGGKPMHSTATSKLAHGLSHPSIRSSTSSSGSSSGASSNRYDMDPVVQLLSTTFKPNNSSMHPSMENTNVNNAFVTFLDAISTETILRPGVRFAFPVLAFTGNLQKALLNQLEMARYHHHAASSPMHSSSLFANSYPSHYNQTYDIDVQSNAAKLCHFLLGIHDNFSSAAISNEILQRLQNTSNQQQQHSAQSTQASSQSQQPQQSQHYPQSPGGNVIMGSPTPSYNNPDINQPVLNAASTVIMLSMLEYYFISFAKFPLCRQQLRQQTSQQPSRPQISQFNTQRMPSSTSSSSFGVGGVKTAAAARKPLAYGDQIYLHLLRSYYLRKYLSHSPNVRHHQSLDPNSEMFLRIMIDFWMEGEHNTPLPTNMALDRYYQSQRILKHNQRLAIPSLEAAYDLTIQPRAQYMLSHTYQSNPALVQLSIRCLVVHLVADPNLYYRTQDNLVYVKSTNLNEINNDPNNMDMDTVINAVGECCLTPQMSIVQPSFYNYVRVAFKYAPLHLADSAFFTALEAWLIWLEPWNVVIPTRKFDARNFTNQGKKVMQQFLPHNNSSSTNNMGASNRSNKNTNFTTPSAPSRLMFPRFDTPSKYSVEKWEPYIAANLHLYIVPLAIFLKRAKELDFSTPHFNKSLEHVQKVLRVFSPALVKTIHKLLSNGVDSNNNNQDDLTPNNVDSYLFVLKKIHEQNLGCYCPPVSSSFGGNFSTSPNLSPSKAPNSGDSSSVSAYHLSQCFPDAQAFLEELSFQQRKKIRELDIVDRFIAKCEGFFGSGVMQGDEKAIQKTVKQLRNLMELPEDVELLPKYNAGDLPDSSSSYASRKNSGDMNSVLRGQDGYLTERGKEEILAGMYKCSSLEMAECLIKRRLNSRDPMMDRVKSYEIPLLVDLSNSLSLWLNTKLGLDESEGEKGPWIEKIFSVLVWIVDKNYFQSIRINLRFMADYRNLIWMGLIFSFLWKVVL